MLNIPHHLRQKGYSLVEMSIALSIVALLLTGGLAIVSKTSNAKRMKITAEHIAEIESAIAAYEAINLYLPCPAVSNALENTSSFGVSATYSTSSHSCTTVSNNTGAVPVRTLNIPDSLAYDGWGRRITYRLATGFGAANDFANSSYMGDLQVTDLAGNEKTAINNKPPYNIGAAYVIISNGADGNATETAIAPSVSGSTSREEENRNHSTNTIYIQDEQTYEFDDIVGYKQKDDVVPITIADSPITVPSYVCSNANSLVSTTALSTLQANNASLATQVASSAKAVKTLCDNPPSVCSALTPASVAPGSPSYLQLWLDANDPNNNGSSSSWSTSPVWKDKSGLAHDATASAAPSYLTGKLPSGTLPSGQSKKSVMSFSGSQSFTANLSFLANSSYSIFVVDVRGNGNSGLYLLGSGSGFNYGYATATTLQLSQPSSTALATTVPTYIANTTVVSSAVFDKTTANSPYNGQSVRALINNITYSNGFDKLTTGLTSSGSTSIGSGYNGYIAEVIIYNRALNANERAAVESYLYRKWVSGECS